MRFPAFLSNGSNGSVASPAWAPEPAEYVPEHLTAEHLPREQQSFAELDHGALAAALDAYVARELPQPAPETLWNFTATSAPAETEQYPGLADDLAEEIAQAMHRRPLMNRLAHVEATYASRPGRLPLAPTPSSTPPMPPPIPVSAPPAEAAAPEPEDMASIHQLMEEFGEPATAQSTPRAPGAWLSNARRERARLRARNLIAWLATLSIGGSIIYVMTLAALTAFLPR